MRLSWLVIAFLLGLSALPATAAEAPLSSEPTITLDLKDVDVRAAIEAVFRNSGKNFSIDQSVQGTISALSLKDVPFETALRNLTRTQRLVYRIDGGVYIITRKPDTSSIARPAIEELPPVTAEVDQPTTSEMQIEKIPLNYASATEILAVMSGSGREFGGYGTMGYPGGRYGGYGRGNYGYGGYPGYGYGSSYGGYPSYGGYGGYPSYGGYPNYGGYGNYGRYGGYGSYPTSGSGSYYRGW